jgi:ribosome-associated protein
MIYITPNIAIEEREIQEEFVRSSGPGGQNVNKLATAVQLRFDVGNSPSLPDDVRERLIRLAGRRMTEGGVLIIDARRFRTQERNRQDAMDRLVQLMRQAAVRPGRKAQTSPKDKADRGIQDASVGEQTSPGQDQTHETAHFSFRRLSQHMRFSHFRSYGSFRLGYLGHIITLWRFYKVPMRGRWF